MAFAKLLRKVKFSFTPTEWVLLACIFLFFANPFGKFYLFGYLGILIVIFKYRSFLDQMKQPFFILSFFSFTYAGFYLTDFDRGFQYAFFYAMFPPLFFVLGAYFGQKLEKGVHIYYLLAALGIIYSLPAMVSVLGEIIQFGYEKTNRTIVLINTGKPTAATGMATYFTVTMCIPAFILAGRKKFSYLQIFLLTMVFVASLLCVLRLGGRTHPTIFALVLITATIYVSKSMLSKERFQLASLILISLGTMYYLGLFDLDANYFSSFGKRIQTSKNTLTAGGRIYIWKDAFESLFFEPFGWKDDGGRFAHNLWLDVARSYGLIPFIILIAFSIKALHNCYKTLRYGQSLIFKMLVLTTSMAFMIVFCLEPIIQGSTQLFILFCFFQGAIWKYVENTLKNQTPDTKEMPSTAG